MLFAAFVVAYEAYTKSIATERNVMYANTMQSFLWNFNKPPAQRSLTLILRASGNKSSRIIQIGGLDFISVNNPDRLSHLEGVLLSLGLIRETTLKSPIQQGNQVIGHLETVRLNRNLYVHLIALVSLIGLVLLANTIRTIPVVVKGRDNSG